MHYAPVVTGFVTRFIAAYVPDTRSEDLPLLTTCLTLVALNVISLHFDLSSLIALSFNRRVQPAPLTAAQKQKITSALYAALPADDPQARAQAEPIIAVMPLLSGSFGFNLSQLRHFTQPKRKIKVAVLLEPTVLGFIDLLVFLDQQPMISLSFADYQHADVIIMDSSLPLNLTGEKQPIIFQWHMDAPSAMFGDLTSLFYTMQQNLTATGPSPLSPR